MTRHPGPRTAPPRRRPAAWRSASQLAHIRAFAAPWPLAQACCNPCRRSRPGDGRRVQRSPCGCAARRPARAGPPARAAPLLRLRQPTPRRPLPGPGRSGPETARASGRWPPAAVAGVGSWAQECGSRPARPGPGHRPCPGPGSPADRATLLNPVGRGSARGPRPSSRPGGRLAALLRAWGRPGVRALKGRGRVLRARRRWRRARRGRGLLQVRVRHGADAQLRRRDALRGGSSRAAGGGGVRGETREGVASWRSGWRTGRGPSRRPPSSASPSPPPAAPPMPTTPAMPPHLAGVVGTHRRCGGPPPPAASQVWWARIAGVVGRRRRRHRPVMVVVHGGPEALSRAWRSCSPNGSAYLDLDSGRRVCRRRRAARLDRRALRRPHRAQLQVTRACHWRRIRCQHGQPAHRTPRPVRVTAWQCAARGASRRDPAGRSPPPPFAPLYSPPRPFPGGANHGRCRAHAGHGPGGSFCPPACRRAGGLAGGQAGESLAVCLNRQRQCIRLCST